MAFDDVHITLLLDQLAEGRPQDDPYSWKKVEVPDASDPRYVVTGVNADRCMNPMRPLIDPFRTPKQ